MNYNSIITHNDFDGVASAALCSFFYKIDNIKFAGPNSIAKAEIPITNQDIVCDLPFPLECGLWFDHHEGNLQELKYRNIDIEKIPGKFEILPSCARVIFNYLTAKKQLPTHFNELVNETDIIDGFLYKSIADWRQETPAKIIDATIRSKAENLHEKWSYLKQLVFWLRDFPLATVAKYPDIIERYRKYQEEEQQMLELIRQHSYFLPNDTNQEIIILDLTNFNRPPFISKNLAYLLFPQSLAVLEIKPIFRNRIKSNDLGLSLSLSINLNNSQHSKDVSEILRELNLGDGHKGAAGGTLLCKSKEDNLKQKRFTLTRILQLWQAQN